MAVPVDKLAATVREGVAAISVGADSALAELVARASQAEADRVDVERRWLADVERLSADMARLREERDAQLKITQNVYELLVEAKRERNCAEARCARLQQALVAMVYVHPCNCGDGIPLGACARCRAVSVLGFDPAKWPNGAAS